MPIEDLRLEPEDCTDSISVDLVAIHGLYEDGLETWTDAGSEILWLRDLFPHTKLKARVLLYTYNRSSLVTPGSSASDRILPHANNLVAELSANRLLSDTVCHPIIFVCHGFGGIVLKRALALSYSSTAPAVEHRRSIYVSTFGILFLGTPHSGISKLSLLLGTGHEENGPSQFMISLVKESGMLQDITDQFAPLLKRFHVFYFWEELQMQIQGSKAFVVDQESAAPPWHDTERCGIPGTHSSMVKFSAASDPGYKVILGALIRYIKQAPTLIIERWRDDRKILATERQNEADALLRHQPSHQSIDETIPSGLNEWFIVPRCSTTYFTGRTQHGNILRERFKSSSQPWDHKYESRTFVIYGLGGSGKTQFCLRYVEDNRSRYWGIFWIDASTDENVESGFSYLGQLAGKGSSLAAGMHWLSNCTQPWLLVLDNADDPEMDVSKYFPAGGRGHILITTRNPGAVEYATVGNFRFHGMDPEEAVHLLLRSAHMLSSGTKAEPQAEILARDIASELGYLALAITHAGAAIRRKIYTLERYLHYYLGLRKDTISGSYVTTADDVNIITTWEIPFQRLSSRRSLEHRYAVELLHIFAFMHFESIPEILIRRVQPPDAQPISIDPSRPILLQEASNWSQAAYTRLRRAIRILCDYSIIEHDADKGLCVLHPLVHQWARARLSPEEQKRWSCWTASILADNVSSLNASEREFRRKLIPHIDASLRVLNMLFPKHPETARQATELAKFAGVYAEHGLWKQARRAQNRVLSFQMRVRGKWHRDTIIAEKNLANTLWNLFDVRQAIEIQVGVLKKEWWKRPSPRHWISWPPWKPNHAQYCIMLKDLTLSLWLAGRRELSKRAGERALFGLLKQLGADDPQTLEAMFNLGRTYLHLKEYQKSHALLTTVVQKRKRFFGPNHPDTLMARNELGQSFRVLGKLEIAERLVKNVLDSRRRTLGEEHAYTMWSINDYSKVLCDRDRAANAVLLLEELLPTANRILGAEHVGITMTESNLARACCLCREWERASAVFSKLMQKIPSDHPDWILMMCGYVYTHSKVDRQPETLQEDCRKVLEMIQNVKGIECADPRIEGTSQIFLRLCDFRGNVQENATQTRRVLDLGDMTAEEDELLRSLHQLYVQDSASIRKVSFWSHPWLDTVRKKLTFRSTSATGAKI